MVEIKRVYVLGAGASFSAGYPLAATFIEDLTAYVNGLDSSSAQIKKACEETISLMTHSGARTIDDLALRVEKGFFDSPSPDPRNRYRERDRLMRNAKVATSALLLSKERAAHATGLLKYRDLMHILFDAYGEHWTEQLENTPHRLITFNYDRLFEIAFKDFLPIDANLSFYGQLILNTGVDDVRREEINFSQKHFSFVKMHGSVGMLAAPGFREIAHHHSFPKIGSSTPINDEVFFKKGTDESIADLLIVFPIEKQRCLTAAKSGRTYHKYITQTWKQAGLFFESAKEIWIIGYSFATPDVNFFMNLLRTPTACDRIVVQDPNANEICRRVEMEFPEFKSRLDPYVSLF